LAELDLYLTEEDELPIIEYALRIGCKVIPDLHYGRAQYDSVTTLQDYKRYRARTRLFFFLSERLLRRPLEMDSIEKQGSTLYYILYVGGPGAHD
jgi:hypothetical protein